MLSTSTYKKYHVQKVVRFVLLDQFSGFKDYGIEPVLLYNICWNEVFHRVVLELYASIFCATSTHYNVQSTVLMLIKRKQKKIITNCTCAQLESQ